MTDCYYCGVGLTGNLAKGAKQPPTHHTQDHQVPRAYQMRGFKDQKIHCCAQCNQEKGMLTPSEYRVVLAFRAGMIPVPDLLFHGEDIESLQLEKLLIAAFD